MGLVVASAVFAFTHFNAGMPTPSTQASIAKTTRVLQPTATIQSHIRISNASFSFTAAGDYGQTSYTTANLNYIARSRVNFPGTGGLRL